MEEKINAPKTEQEKAQEFAKEYNELCQKYGYTFVVTPIWKMSQDNGDYRLVLESSVKKLPKQQ